MSREQLATIGVTSESLGQMIVEGDYITPIVEEAGCAVAFAMAQVSECCVFAVFVLPGHEKRGYGRAVLEAAEAGLRNRGVKRAWLNTAKDPDFRAHGFYQHLGWAHVSFMPDGQARYEKEFG